MVREIVVWCSVHLLAHDGERVPARSVTVSLDGKKPRTLDLCEVCAKELVSPLAEALTEYGDKDAMPAPRSHAAPVSPARVTARQPAATSDQAVCLVCGSSVNMAGESTHYMNVHGTSKGRWLIDHGQGQGVEECPVSGCAFAAMNATGIGVHVSRTKDAKHAAYRASHPTKGSNQARTR